MQSSSVSSIESKTVWTVYELVDPTTREIRYVGLTQLDPYVRLASHLGEVGLRKGRLSNAQKKEDWILSLLRKGLCPKVEIVGRFSTSSNAHKIESEWIQGRLEQGCDLINVRGRPRSLESRIRQSISTKGRENVWGQKAAASRREKGGYSNRPPVSLETRQKISRKKRARDQLRIQLKVDT